MDIECAWKWYFAACDSLIAEVAAWFDGKQPAYWDKLLPEIADLNLKDKKVAVSGLAGQVKYPLKKESV